MTYSVDLVQRGISAQTHPVSGKSGKLFGNAVASPRHGGVVLVMTLADYIANMHDLIGNTAPSQQWVPEFVAEAGSQNARQKCDRCPKPSVAIWDRFYFCADHAPGNAEWYDPTEKAAFTANHPVEAPAVTTPRPETVDDVRPAVVEKPFGTVKDPLDTELPMEVMAPPVMGTERENESPSGDDVIPPQMRRPVETKPTGEVAQPPPAAASERVEPTAAAMKQPEPPKVNAVEVITTAVVNALMPKLTDQIQTQMATLREELIARKNGSGPANVKVEKKQQAQKRNAPPTEFQLLQRKAKSLGINTFGMDKGKIRDAIAAQGAAITS